MPVIIVINLWVISPVTGLKLKVYNYTYTYSFWSFPIISFSKMNTILH